MDFNEFKSSYSLVKKEWWEKEINEHLPSRIKELENESGQIGINEVALYVMEVCANYTDDMIYYLFSILKKD